MLSLSKFFTMLENLGNDKKINAEIIFDEKITAPICKGQEVGKIIYKLDGKTVGENPILANEDICELTFFKIFINSIKNIVS